MTYVYAVLWIDDTGPNVNLYADRTALEIAYPDMGESVIDHATAQPGEAAFYQDSGGIFLRYVTVTS